MNWTGVIPAMTTAWTARLAVDHRFMARHARWMIDAGCTGIVALGSLGEGATLTFEEKEAILKTLVDALGKRAPVIAGVSALSTAEAVRIAKMAEQAGCQGLMVLPPYVYASDWSEMRAHVSAVMRATRLSCMLYNNPLAYKTDFTPPQIAELAAEHANLHAVKESSADIRRLAAIRALIGQRLSLLVGVDDMIVEGARAGATGWIAGLVNAFPRESVVLFEAARSGEMGESLTALYNWFLPLLRLDVTVKFVQQIKLTQERVGMGNARVRPPRLELAGEDLAYTTSVIDAALAARPRV